MEINIHINSTYNVSHSREIEALYGMNNVAKCLSFSVPLQISIDSCKDKEKLIQTLSNAGIDSSILKKIRESLPNATNYTSEQINSIVLEAFKASSLHASRELSGIIIIGNRLNEEESKESPMLRSRSRLDLHALSVVIESSYMQKISDVSGIIMIDNDEEQKEMKTKWYHKLCCL